jgi:hypothetical protein
VDSIFSGKLQAADLKRTNKSRELLDQKAEYDFSEVRIMYVEEAKGSVWMPGCSI